MIAAKSSTERGLNELATQEAGADTVDLAANPRVAYLLIESEQIRWRVTLEEAVPVSPANGSARD